MAKAAAAARLNAAVSHAGFGCSDPLACTSVVERITDLSQASHEVRKGPQGETEGRSSQAITLPTI
jgi:hypothetical protein